MGSQKVDGASLIKQMQSTGVDSFTDNVERTQAVEAAHALIARIQSPFESAMRFSWTHPTMMACVQTFYDLGLFETWDKSGGGVKSSAELCAMANKPVDPVLFRRLVRHLAATNVLFEVSEDKYEMSPYARAVSDKALGNTIPYFTLFMSPSLEKFNTFLQKQNYQNPTSVEDSNHQHAFNTKDNHFEWLAGYPVMAEVFNNVMTAVSGQQGKWVDVYPTEELLKGTDGVILVDIGGSLGHDLERFLAKHPDAHGKYVLEDLPEVIDAAKKQGLHNSIEPQAWDFFASAQPVTGARAYFMHHILHDWPDSKAEVILKNVKAGMKPGYSKLLLYESVVSAYKPHIFATTKDLTMAAALSASERTEQSWRDLLTSQGLRISKIHTKPGFDDVVLECDLAQ